MFCSLLFYEFAITSVKRGAMCDHGHHCHGHDHSHDAEDNSAQFNLYLKVDLDHVECLNEEREGSGRTVFKPWDQRLDLERCVESDVDAELLFNIPFNGTVKLKAISVIGGENMSLPKEMRLFKNIPDMSFDNTAKEPDQIFSFPDPGSELVLLKFPTKPAKFSSISHLSIHFPDSGRASTKIYYIGLAGDFLQARREEVVITAYELRANPADHKNKLFDPTNQMIS